MKQLVLTAAITFAALFSNQTHAQSLASLNEDVTYAKALAIDKNDADWAFYADENNKKYFIDFDKLHIYLDKIEVVDEQENVIFTDNLWNIPSDALYELDCSNYQSGKYSLRLKSLTEETISVNIEIKE
jgi:hypothetical protein